VNSRWPEGLTSLEVTLGPDEFALLRQLAFRAGTVVERDGLSVLGFGRAATFDLANGLADPAPLSQLTAALSSTAPSGASPATVLIGALPFLPNVKAALCLPRVAVVCRDGHTATAAVHGITPSAASISALLGEAEVLPDGSPPDAFTLRSARPHEDFLHRVAAAVGEIRSGSLDKVVLAREVVVEANRPFRQGDLLERLRALHPSCTTFAVDGFLGATPELLIRRTGRSFASHPLAGTAPRSGDPDADRRLEAALLESEKEREEHRAVVDAIAGALASVAASLEVPAVPEIVELRNVSHLGTHITGELRNESQAAPSALELLARIHPTPAVSGSPADVALEYLTKVEEIDRDRYAGAVGWIDSVGDGEWHLGIRSAIVDGHSARLFAGVGIVSDSEPLAELAETQLKLQAVLAAAVRP
jgi:menaquinone-specific isochorismate synthase